MTIPINSKKQEASYASASNPCRQCMPLGASWALKGIEKCMTILHGSQGCATYIRRYMISHFREPIDIASSSFDETTVIFGGEEKLEKAVLNVFAQYHPEIIGIATTCLSETIGDDVDRFILGIQKRNPQLCPLIPISTPSYEGTQEEGFQRTLLACVKTLAGQYHFLKGSENKQRPEQKRINLFLPMITPADIRWLKNLVSDMEGTGTFLPDYSETLDGGMWDDFQAIPPGGTSYDQIIQMDQARGSIEIGTRLPNEWRAGYWLQKKFGLPNACAHLPLGVESTDHFLNTLSEILDSVIPINQTRERARLIDAYADGHKYLYGKKVVLFGDTATVEALYRFTSEIGMDPVFCFTGSSSGILSEGISQIAMPAAASGNPLVKENCDFGEAEPIIKELNPDLMIGNSKGYKIARKLEIPLLRVGFPIHDRFGASRQRMLGYGGSMELLDRIINVILEKKQSSSSVGYTYI